MTSSIAMLPKLNFLFTLVALGLLITGFIPNRWLKADFSINVPGKMIREDRPAEVFALVPSSLSDTFDNLSIPVNVTSRMGLYINCKEQLAIVLNHELEANECDREGEMGWQALAFGLGAAGLFFGLMSLILSAMVAFVRRFANNIGVNFGLVVLDFFTICGSLGPVFMYIRNRNIQVKPPLHDIIAFDTDWALHLTWGTSAFFGLIMLSKAFYIVLLGRGESGSKVGVIQDTFKMNGVSEVARF